VSLVLLFHSTVRMPVAPLSDLGLASGSGLGSASTSAAATSGLPSGPPPPPDTAMPVTPPTSPQRSQHAAHQHERVALWAVLKIATHQLLLIGHQMAKSIIICQLI
jgi:hypothetical protein